MKKILALLTLLFLVSSIQAQIPEKTAGDILRLDSLINVMKCGVPEFKDVEEYIIILEQIDVSWIETVEELKTINRYFVILRDILILEDDEIFNPLDDC